LKAWQRTLIAPESESLVRGLLELNARRRLTAEEALTHPWLTGDVNG